MNVKYNISLKPYNTFGVDVKASSFINIKDVSTLKSVLKTNQNKPLFILSGGSNILLTKNINALVIYIQNKGIEIIEETNTHVIVKANAGENWHNFVLWCLKNNYGGLENLSLIPGQVGTAPIQNIGAYGVELKDVFVSCNAINIKTQEEQLFNKEDCNFGYRQSIFKQELKGQFIITNVSFKLTKNNHILHTDYGAIQSKLLKMKIENPTIQDVSKAIITIRSSKLPDPKEIGNSGSFFKNPIISVEAFKTLQKQFKNIPSYKVSTDLVKIPAAWLIETAGFKGKRFGNYGVHKNQALVLVNYGNANGNDIYNLAILIKKTVKRLFNITITPEVNII